MVSLDSKYMVSYWWLISNIGHNLALLRDIRLWNLIDPEFDLPRSLKMNCDGVFGLTTYGFLLMVNSNTGPNSAPLQDIRLWNLSDLDFDLSRSLKGKGDDVIRLIMYAFLLMVNSKIGANLAPLQDMMLLNLSDFGCQGNTKPKEMMSLDSHVCFPMEC